MKSYLEFMESRTTTNLAFQVLVLYFGTQLGTFELRKLVKINEISGYKMKGTQGIIEIKYVTVILQF